MALIVRYGATSGSNTLDQAATGFCQPRVSVTYQGPAQFRFRLYAAQHTAPIPLANYIEFEDNDAPGIVFKGHVWEIIPQESNVLDYVCYDPTMRARNEITIMSGPHGDAQVIPRLVYNSKIDNDEDYAFEKANDYDVSQIMGDLFTHASSELTAMQAGSLASADVAGMDYKPQEKIVFESELFGAGIDRLLNWYPQYRVLYDPALAQWRFLKPRDSTAVTLTLNDFQASKKVLSFALQRNISQRYSAVKIYGPQQFIVATVESGAGLTEDWDIFAKNNFETNGPTSSGIFNAGKRWQITDSTKRKIARLLPALTEITDSQFNSGGDSNHKRFIREPTLQATWESDGDPIWTVPAFTIDFKNGYIETPTPIYQYKPSGTPKWKLPTFVRFTYAYFDTPLSVRYPTSGHAGTMYDVTGKQVELRIYDEMLAVGYEKGSPVTSAARQAQFVKLAQAIHEAKSDIVYTGGCTLEGLDYDFLRLDKRVHFGAVNGSGGTITTGWEAIGAIVSDVEYDYENRVTTLTFSSDYAAFMQTNYEELKRLLKIRALQQVQLLDFRLTADGQDITQELLLRNLYLDNGEIVGES